MTPEEARAYVRMWASEAVGGTNNGFSNVTEQVLDKLGDKLSEHVDGLERRTSQSEIHQARLRGQLRELQDLLVEAARGLVLADVTGEKELVSARIPLKTAKKMREMSRPLMIEQGMEDFGVKKPERFELFRSNLSASNLLEQTEYERELMGLWPDKES